MMAEKEAKIGSAEMAALLILSIITPLMFNNNTLARELTGSAHWISIIIAFIFGILGLLALLCLLRRFPGQNIMQIFNQVYGRKFGFVASLLLFLLFITTVAVEVRTFAETTKTYDYDTTPTIVIVGLVLMGAAIICWLGVESLARISVLLGYLLIPLLFIILALLIPNLEVANLFPILGHGTKNLLLCGFTESYMYGSILFIGVFADVFQEIKSVKKAAYTGVLVSGALIFIYHLFFNMTLGYETITEEASDMFFLITSIEQGRFFQRLDALLSFPMNIGTFISVSVGMCGALKVYRNMFDIQNRRVLLLPAIFLLLALAMIAPDYPTVVFVYNKYVRGFSIAMMYLIPLLTLITAVARKKRRRC
jgi:spore germination protein KB